MALYTILDITDQEIKDKLAVSCDNQPFIATAPMVLIFCADYRRWYDVFCDCVEEVRKPAMGDLFLAEADAIIAAQNAVVAAQSLGLGRCGRDQSQHQNQSQQKDNPALQRTQGASYP